MIKSMTGYGRGAAEGEAVKVTVDIRTVNNRYLDLHVRLAQEHAGLEVPIKKQVQAALRRGRVDLTLAIERAGGAGFSVNRDLVRGYLAALDSLRQEFNVQGEATLDVLLRIPGLLQSTTESTTADSAISSAVTVAVGQAIAEVVAMRAVEGTELAAEMNGRLDAIEQLIPSIEKRAEDLPGYYRERLEKRLAELTRGKPLDEARVAQEAAYIAERSDIAEEIARLKSHLVQFRQTLLGESGEAGKRLDFLLQEMNREANTILSKSGDLGISESAITIKTEVEKLREQVQNVE